MSRFGFFTDKTERKNQNTDKGVMKRSFSDNKLPDSVSIWHDVQNYIKDSNSNSKCDETSELLRKNSLSAG